MKTYKAGVIGTGFIGVAHVEALRRLGNIEVVAITDTQDHKIKAEMMNIPNSFADYKEMMDTLELDMIHICTPNNTHHEIAMYAMKKGINVVCEKPMTKTADEAKEMCEYAKEHNIVNAVNFHNRFNPMVHQIKEWLPAESLEKLFLFTEDMYRTGFCWKQTSTGE